MSSDSNDRRPAKRRRPRAQLSCSECRRLKMKCDRQFPCANCQRRECSDICRRQGPPSSMDNGPKPNVQDRLALLEDLLHQNGISVPQISTATQNSHDSRPPQVVMAAHDLSRTSFTHPRVPSPTGSSGGAMLGLPALTAAVDIVDQRIQSAHFTEPMLPHAIVDPASYPEVHVQIGALPESSAIGDEEQSSGTLVMFPSGRAKYLGRTAASEWLKNQEAVEMADSPPPVSRLPSPGPGQSSADPWPPFNPVDLKVAFPFDTAARSLSTAALLSQLPTLSDGRTLVDVYFRHFSWHFHVVSEEKTMTIFNKAYGLVDKSGEKRTVAPDQLALLYIILAMGAYYNLELPPDDSAVEEYLTLSRCCLAKADFMARNTIAAVQTLHIMAHLQLSMESGRNGDSAWPLWGLMIRILQAMGLHRDGKRWGLPEAVIEERRRVFWECYSTDVMSSNCFSRPGSISTDYFDTAFPTVPHGVEELDLFYRKKFEMSSLFIRVLDHAMKVQVPPYSNVQALHESICTFEQNVPFELRCRPVLCALSSTYPDPDAAIQASPPINKRNLQHTFQQFTLEMNISEALVFLHRPYFARALHESVRDPTRSRFGQSYLAVVERCNAIVVIASNLYELYPQAAARHWWIWYHAFNSAACMGTLVLKNPQNVLATFALTLVETVIKIYSSVVQSRNSPRMVKNLKWLVNLRGRLESKMAQTPEDARLIEDMNATEDDDVALLGWKTRLIERAGQGLRRATTIISSSPGSTMSPFSPGLPAPRQTPSSALPANFNSTGMGQSTSGTINVSGDSMLDPFWDPLAAQDGTITTGDIASVNWWSHGFGGDQGDIGNLFEF